MGKKMKRVPFVLLLFVFMGCASTAYRDIPFDYSQVLTKEYRFGTGRSIPLTFERSVNVSGSITADGKFFIYASNKERNNFDIYLRALNDITTVRVTMHPARDFSPDIAMDGKWCAFVSTRDDPEGDIFIIKLDPEKIIAQGDQEVPSKNITVIKDPLSGAVRPVRDASPCFSPDGKFIAFSSTRDGEESIYIMGREGTGIRKITEGMQPRFSSDGKELIFVKKSRMGSNVFTINLVTGEINQITNNKYVELSPSFGKSSNEIYFIRIQYDTNNDGIVDANDRGMLYGYNVNKNEEYPLTLIEEPSATPRWVPYAEGVIVYSIVEDKFINIAMIPHTGIIPKQKNAQRQYELALKYKEDFDDEERYLRCLFATYHFFKEANDADSKIVIAKALYELSYVKQYSFVSSILADMASDSKPALIYSRIKTVKDREKISLLENSVKELSAQNDEKLAPFFMEELADVYVNEKMYDRARSIYSNIIAKYPNYTRLMYVRYKAGLLAYNTFTIPEEWIAVLQSSYTYLKNAITVEIIENTKNIPAQERYTKALEAAGRYTVPIVKTIMNYVAAAGLIELSRNDEAITLLKQGLEHTKKLDVAYFLINVTLGQLYYVQKNDEWVVCYEAAVNNYQAQWKQDIRSIIEQLIEYFENTGQRLGAEGNFKDAAALYKRYITMNTLLHLKRRYRDIYSAHAPDAHTGYINAMLALLQSSSINNIEKEYLERLPIARMDFDKAHIYGLGYIYVKQAQELAPSPEAMDGRSSQEFETLLGLFSSALRHIDWSLFIDDMFVDAYLLKGWIYQYIDELRVLFPSKKRVIDAYFPEYLWEKTIPMYEKALAANDENINPQREADIYCNTGNIYFLLKNFNLAARNYAKAIEFKKVFSNLKEEALFYYHYGYCLWQQGNYAGAHSSMQKAYAVYRAIAQKNESAIAETLYTLYKYFALFERMQGNYDKTIEWYSKALIQITRFQIGESPSRLYIEIAECYRRMDNDSQALVYLELARRSLQKETSVQYKIGWKFAGLGPVYFYDLGQDTVVIGEGKIVSQLSGTEMEVLINNMQADIYAKGGRFQESVAHYLAVAEITKKQKTSLMADAHFTALYNAGYCYAQAGSMSKALELYDRALTVAKDKNITIDKIYQILVQWSYCYTSSLKNSIQQNAGLDDALEIIAQQKSNMYEKVYTALVDEYTNKMKAQKKKVSDQDIAVLKEQATKQVEAYSIKFDALSAILYMHKAAIMEQSLESTGDASYSSKVNVIIQYYRDAEKLFSTAISYYGNDALHQEYVVKLLINRGICRIRAGKFREGYDDIISARFKANKIQSKDLLWTAEATLWDLAHMYKEIKQLIENTDKLIAGVLQRVELLPPLYAMKKEFIQKLYDSYTDELINNKRYKEAYAIQERKQIVTMAFNALSIPYFYNESDTILYNKYLKTCFTIQDLEQKLTKAILEEDSVEKYKASITSQYKKLSEYKASVSVYLSPYLGVYAPQASELPVVHFYLLNNALYGWVVYKNTIDWKLISKSPWSKELSEDVRKFLQPLGGKIYCILNDAFIAVHTNISNSVLNGLGCVPSISRVADAERLVWLPEGKIATDTKLPNFENVTSNINESEYIVDTDKPVIAITPHYCYANKTECSALLKYMETIKADELMLLADAALYSHIATVILYSGKDTQNLVVSFLNNDLSLVDSLKEKVIVLGKVPDSKKVRDDNVQKVVQKKQKEFNDALVSGKYDEALSALQRWRRAGLTLKEYSEKKIQVLIYMNKLDEALELIRSQDSTNAISYSAYVYLLKGDSNSAEKIIADSRLAQTFDYIVYKALIKANKYKEKLPDSIEIPKQSISILPVSQLLLLYAQGAYLLGESEKAKTIMKLYKADYIPSQRELLVAHNLGYSIDFHTNTVAYKMIKTTELENYSANPANVVEEYSTIYPFAILEIITQKPAISNEEWQHIMLIAEKSNKMCWLDIQFTTAKLATILNSAIPSRTLQYIDAVATQKGMIVSHIVALNKINAYQKTNNFVQAYDSCKSLKQVPFELEKIWYANYIYSAIMTGKTGEAQKLLNESKMATWDAPLYTLFDLNIQLQKISTEKTAESTLLQIIAKNIDVLVGSLQGDVIQWYYAEYKYLLDKLINYAISYAMSRGNQREALRYAELQRMIIGIATFNENNRYKSIYNELIAKNFPIIDIQKNIPRQTALLYITKNENDIFAWIITKTFIQPVRLQNAYTQLYGIVADFYNRVGLLQQTFDTEAAISDIMKPVIRELSGYTSIVVIPDAYTESIPYEIIQFNKSDMAINFMPCLVTALDENGTVAPITWINVDNTRNPLIVSALKQSGLAFTFDTIAKGIMIVDVPVEYNNLKKELMINDYMLQTNFLFINLSNTLQIPYNYLLFMIQKEMGKYILLNTSVADVNRIIFIREFCKAVTLESIVNSLISAQQYLKKDKRFKHPAYWMGIRLYSRTLKGIYDGVR